MKFTNKKYFTSGKRGIIYTALYGKKKIAIKKKKPDSEAVGRIANEGKWMAILNKKGIGPRLVKKTNTYVAYEFVEGEFFPKWAETASKKQIQSAIKNLFNQCLIMDKLKVDKEELHRPFKHIVISEDGPVMLDFERCHETEKPKNVTQFAQYMMSSKPWLKGLRIKKEKIMFLAKTYKETYEKKDFEALVTEVLS